MGVSTDAYLFFGFDFFAPASGKGNSPQWREEGDDRFYWSEWASSRQLREQGISDKLEKLNIYIGSHCSSDFPIWFICTEESYVCAWRGYPKEAKMEAGENAVARLKEACELLGIEFEEPKWWLASYWG